jgi:hypothetical protein
MALGGKSARTVLLWVLNRKEVKMSTRQKLQKIFIFSKTASYTMYIARLVSQEISMMKETKSPRVAYNRQSKLLKDAFAED